MKEVGLLDMFKEVVDTARSEETKKTYKMAGLGLYMMSRWVLGSVLHPIATFKATMLIGDEETIKRNVERALRLPKFPFPKGRQRLQ